MQRSHLKERDLQPVPDPIPLTEDGYATLEPESDNGHDNADQVLVEISTDRYTLLSKKQPEAKPGDTGYDEVNDQDVIRSHYEMSEYLPRVEKDDYHDYEESYWEPANKEEELMDQLSKLNMPVIQAKDIE